jgi:heterodisulfide reductase subunit A-like polyferredoxin
LKNANYLPLLNATHLPMCFLLCRNVHDITLSYTFFKVDEDEADSEPADGSSSGVKLHGPGELPAGIPAAVAAAAAAAAAAGSSAQPAAGLTAVKAQ